MRKMLLTAGAAAAWLLAGHLGMLAVLAYVWGAAMTATTNTAKTRAVEQRVNALVTAQTTQNQAIAQLQQGIFTNVSGGSVITLSTQQGSVTLHCGALSYLTSGPQAQFLAGLSQMQSPGGVATDGGGGNYWETGERALINTWADAINAILGTAIGNGFMKAA